MSVSQNVNRGTKPQKTMSDSLLAGSVESSDEDPEELSTETLSEDEETQFLEVACILSRALCDYIHDPGNQETVDKARRGLGPLIEGMVALTTHTQGLAGQPLRSSRTEALLQLILCIPASTPSTSRVFEVVTSRLHELAMEPSCDGNHGNEHVALLHSVVGHPAQVYC